MGMETINAADWGVLPGDDVSLAARLGALLSTLCLLYTSDAADD